VVPLLAEGWSHAAGGTQLKVVPCCWRATPELGSCASVSLAKTARDGPFLPYLAFARLLELIHLQLRDTTDLAIELSNFATRLRSFAGK
jgi:hypothetical protein